MVYVDVNLFARHCFQARDKFGRLFTWRHIGWFDVKLLRTHSLSYEDCNKVFDYCNISVNRLNINV